jgi:hypothetical protein
VAVPTDRQNQKHCALHDVWYSKLEQCGECRRSAGSAVERGSPKADMSGHRVNAGNARLRELSCWENSNNSRAQDDGNVAVKWSAEAVKWARVAMELEQQIVEVEHDQWLVDQKRKLG